VVPLAAPLAKNRPQYLELPLTLTASNFRIILQAAFEPIFYREKSQSQTVIREKLCKALMYKKARVKC
jgi:hypothetical protein